MLPIPADLLKVTRYDMNIGISETILRGISIRLGFVLSIASFNMLIKPFGS